MAVIQETHVVRQSVVFVDDPVAMLEQNPSGIGEPDTASAPLEKLHAVGSLQLLHMPADSRLTDIQLLRGLREAQVAGYAAEYFQSEIGHRFVGFSR